MTAELGDVDVVVVTYNSRAHIERCLRSLAVNERIASIAIVDNASADDTVRCVESFSDTSGHAVRIARLGLNLGFGTAANRGIAATNNKYVCVVNPDIDAKPNMVDALAEYLDAHPQCAVVGPQVFNPDGSLYPSSRSFPSPAIAAGHALVGLVWKNNPFSKRYLSTDRHFPDWVSGTAMLLRRTAVEPLGGFDEGYFMYVEDLDLCWRLRDVGHEVGFCSESEVTHEIGGSSQASPYRLIVAHHRSAWRFARKSSRGMSRLLLPAYATVLTIRLGVALALKRFDSGAAG